MTRAEDCIICAIQNKTSRVSGGSIVSSGQRNTTNDRIPGRWSHNESRIELGKVKILGRKVSINPMKGLLIARRTARGGLRIKRIDSIDRTITGDFLNECSIIIFEVRIIKFISDSICFKKSKHRKNKKAFKPNNSFHCLFILKINAPRNTQEQ